MFVTQDLVLRFFFSKKKILNNDFSVPINSSIILAPTHRSRWDGLALTFAAGRRITNKDCRFMVTNPEMKGIQGWFLKRLGCFSVNQASPSLFSLRYAINLIVSENQLVIFPEGKINKNGKKVNFKQGLFRLAKLASKKGTSVNIVPIGIAYSRINPRFRDQVALCIEKPLNLNDFDGFSIDEFNNILRSKINEAESNALGLVGR